MVVRQEITQRSPAATFALVAVLVLDVLCLVVVASAGSAKETLGNLFFQTYTVVGLLLYLRRPHNPIGRLFVVAGTGASLAGATGAILDEIRSGSLELSGAVVHLVGAVQSLAWLPTFVVPLIFVALLFPDGRPLSARWKLVGKVAGVAVAVAATCLVTSTMLASTDEIVVSDSNYHEAAARAVYSAVLVALFIALGCAALAIASLFVRYRRGDARIRQQIKLVMYAAVVAAFAMLFDGHLGLPSDVLLPFGVPLIAVATAVAVTRYRLYDIDRLVSRAVSYAVLTTALVGVYVGSVTLTTQALPFSSSFGVATSTLLAAAAFHPVRRRVHILVDRRFNRTRYDAELVVDAFAQRSRHTVDAGEITAEMVEVVERTVQPQSLSLWLMPTV